MVVQTLKTYLRKWNRTRSSMRVDSLYPPERFLAILDRERGRSDRNSHGFSLVVYDLDPRNGADAHVSHLVKTLQKRTRATDESGWIDPHHIGVLLPETYSDGAHRFAQQICRKLDAARVPPPPFVVQTYPRQSHEAQTSPSGAEGRQNNVSYGAPSSATAAKADLGDRPSDRRIYPRSSSPTHSTAPDPNTSATEVLEALQSAQKFRALFAQSVPRWKRAVDIVGSSLLIVALSPLLLLTALYIKIVSRGPVFFKQTRVGYLGKTFSMWKFRSMKVHNDTTEHKQYLRELISADEGEDKPMVKQEDSSRIIPFGKILRAASIDELPQLFNVFLGDMSLVGPRPPIPYEVEEYHHWHTDRFETVPGMTGLWQVSGKNKLTFKEMIRLDIRYARNLNFWRDMVILLKTGPTVFSLALEGLSRKLSKEDRNVGKEAA